MKQLFALLLMAHVVLVSYSAAQTNPVPIIYQPLVPASIQPGSLGFTLVVNGSGFVPGAVVNWNGSPRVTQFVSRSRVKAGILTTDVANATTALISVSNPGTRVRSNVQFFQVTNRRSAVFVTRTDLPAGAGASNVITGDFNGDGRLDILVCHPAASVQNAPVSVLLGNGNGTFKAPVNSIPNNFPHCAAIGDFNGDGKLDVIVTDGSSTFSVLLGNGDGTFRKFQTYLSGGVPSSGATGDFNGDGKLDVVICNVQDNTISVFLGNGDGTFQPRVNYATGQAPESAVVGDFNGDGTLDIAIANGNDSSVSILLGNGDGTFGQHSDFPIGSTPDAFSLIGADFNGDGQLDLATSMLFSAATALLPGNGDGTFRSAMDFGTAPFPESISVGDFNGDSILDIATSDCMATSCARISGVSMLLGNGDGSFQTFTNYPAGFAAVSIASSDFNNDGKLELVTANQGDGTVSVLLQVDAAVPAASLSTSALKFPVQLVGTKSRSKTVVLTNTGSATLTITSITASGDFVDNTNCPSSLVAGSFCEIKVSFTPHLRGLRTGSITSSDNAPTNPQVITLSGVGTVVSLSANHLVFPSQPVGTKSAPMSITLTNTGATALNFTSIGIVGLLRAEFAETNTCGSSIPAGGMCTISVTFTPLVTGTIKATLSISDDGGGSPQNVGLSGTGT